MGVGKSLLDYAERRGSELGGAAAVVYTKGPGAAFLENNGYSRGSEPVHLSINFTETGIDDPPLSFSAGPGSFPLYEMRKQLPAATEPEASYPAGFRIRPADTSDIKDISRIIQQNVLKAMMDGFYPPDMAKGFESLHEPERIRQMITGPTEVYVAVDNDVVVGTVEIEKGPEQEAVCIGRLYVDLDAQTPHDCSGRGSSIFAKLTYYLGRHERREEMVALLEEGLGRLKRA